MSLTATEFAPQTVDPTVGRCLVLYENTSGVPAPVLPDSGRIGWTADDSGQVVVLSEAATFLLVSPVATGTAHLTATGYEQGQIVTATVTVIVTEGVDGKLVAAVSSVSIQLIVDGGTPSETGVAGYDAGGPVTSVFAVILNGGSL